MLKSISFFLSAVFTWINVFSQVPVTPKKVLVLAEPHGIHRPFVDTAILQLELLAKQERFHLDFIDNADSIGEKLLSQYALLIQLDFPPYHWSDSGKSAFQKAIREGSINWLGFHHATLLGEFDGYPMWPWFSDFMGVIRWKNYIATFASARVKVEDRQHPVTKGLPPSFVIAKEEWYTWDKSPRPNVQVLLSADESTYKPTTTVKMGDHPVVWTNPAMKARNIYIFMGHHGGLFQSKEYLLLFNNAVRWTLGLKN